MIKELDSVVLKHNIAKDGLVEGDVGVVVHCYTDGDAYEVEFVTAEGRTIAVLTLVLNDVRLMSNKEIRGYKIICVNSLQRVG